MAERLAYLEAVVGADITQFRKSMRDIRNDVGLLSETIGGIGGVARTMTFAFTAPMVALGTYAVQAAMGFDAAMRNINSILGLSESQFSSLQAEVFDFAKTTRAGVIPATEALYEVFSAGITDQERAIAVWKTSVMVAEAGLADLSQTTNAITATMSAYNLETSEAERVGNVWTRMVQVGVGSLGDFLSNSQKVLPLSAALNISLEDMGATLAFLSQGGGGARKAETAYAMMLSNLLKPTEAAKNAFQALGVASGQELIAKFGSVSNAIKALYDEVGANSFNTMFSKTGLEAALRITSNFEAMQEAIKEFNIGLDTATLDAWNQQAQSFAMQWDLMKSAIGAVAILLGQAIIPLIAPLVVGFSKFLTELTEVNPQLLQLGVTFVAVVAGAAPLVWLLTSLINPFGLIAAAVITLGGAVATNFNNIQTTIGNAITTILGDMEPLKNAFETFMGVLFPAQEEIPNADTPIIVDATSRIVVTEPTSLWDIYQAQGYKDIFSWEDFYQKAIEGGWEGGAINIDDHITITGGEAIGSSAAQDVGRGLHDGMGHVWQDPNGPMTPPPNFLERLGSAIVAAWPEVQSSLTTMWSNFKSWVTGTAIPTIDSFGGQIIGAIAGWFDTSASNFEGDGAVYDVLTGVLTTDIGGGVQDAAGAFGSQFPQLSAALSTLFDNMAKWIEAEGVPTIARSIGFLAGRVGSLLVDALGMITGGAGDAAGAAGTFLGTSVFTPMMEGISEGAGGVQGDSIFTNFLEKISAGLLLAAGAWVIAPGIVTAVATPIIGLVSAAFTEAAASSVLISGWATKAGTIATIVKGGLLTAFGLVGVIGLGAIILGWILNDPDMRGGLEAWRGIFENFAVIVTTIVDDIKTTVNTFLRGLSGAFFGIRLELAKIDFAVNPNEENTATLAGINAEMQAFDIVTRFEESLNNYVSGASVSLDIGGLVWGMTGQPDANGAIAPAAMTEYLRNNFFGQGMLFDAIQRAASDEMLAQDLEILIPIAIALSSEQTNNDPNQMLIDLVAKSGLDVDTIAAGMKDYFANDPVIVDQIDVAVTAFKLLWGENGEGGAAAAMNEQANTELANTAVTGETTVELPVTPVIDNVDTAMQSWATSVATGMPAAVTTAVSENAGNMDAAATSMTTPFVTAFTNAFAPEGTVTSIWTTFLTDFVTDVQLLETTVTEKAPLVQAAIVDAMTNIRLAIIDTKTEIDLLLGKLDSLAGKVITFTLSAVPGEGVGPVIDGSHAGGLDYVPEDGYIAELHKGEAVLTADQAESYRSTSALPEMQNSGTIDNSQVVFSFYESIGFDDFLREANRRGYKLERYK